MTKRTSAPPKESWDRRFLRQINKAHVSGELLLQVTEVAEQVPPAERDFFSVTMAAARLFQGNPVLMQSAFVRMNALMALLREGPVPGWAKPPDPEGTIAAHHSLFHAAGEAPLRRQGGAFRFSRASFLKLAFQHAKALRTTAK